MQKTIVSRTVDVPAETETTLAELAALAVNFRRIDVTIRNTGENPATGAKVLSGALVERGNDPVRASVMQSALSAGGVYNLTLTDEDVPAHLDFKLTSDLGTSITIEAVGICHPGAF